MRKFLLLSLFLLTTTIIHAQTSAFTYQGRLTDNSLPANGSYTMKFRLYGSSAMNDQIGGEQTTVVTASNGIFTANLNFGPDVFGTNGERWLEIQIGTTTLSPRQQIFSSPYAIRSLNSNQADALSGACSSCVTDAQVASLDGAKVTGSVTNAVNAVNANTANNALNLGGTAASGYLKTTGGTIIGSLDIDGNLYVSGIVNGNGAGLYNLNVPGTLAWQSTSGTSVQAVPNKGYAANNNSQVTVTLPDTSSLAISDTVRISSIGMGGWKIAQKAGQYITSFALPETLNTWTGYNTSGSWDGIASSADGSKLVATTFGGGIFTSNDFGVTWTGHLPVKNWEGVASSADGTKLVAIVANGQIYTSTDSGVNWTPRDSNRNWQSVASSSDGAKLVATVGAGQIYTSTDSGASWTPRESVRNWRGVASSADGTKLVAVVTFGQIYTSTNSGVSWTPHDSARDWQSVASSADGTKLVAVVNGGQIYTSTDSGVTWRPRETNRDWLAVTSSADGSRLTAVAFNEPILISTDSGNSWIARESAREWRGVASSADGNIVAALGFNMLIYTNLSKTTTGTAGYITGVVGSAVELQYAGNGKFVVISHEGSLSYF